MLDDVIVYANGKAVMVLRGGQILKAAPGYTAKRVPGGLRRGAPPGQLKGENLFGMGATMNTLPLYANLDDEVVPEQKTFSEEDATRFEGLDEFGDNATDKSDEGSNEDGGDGGVF